MKSRGFSLLETTLAVALLAALLALTFSLFARGSGAFRHQTGRSTLETELRRCMSRLQSDVSQGSFGLASVINGANTPARRLASGDERDGLCLPSVKNWSVVANTAPPWDCYTVYYATMQTPGQLIEQVYTPSGAPFSGPLNSFSVTNCMNDDASLNSGGSSTRELSQQVKSFEVTLDGATSSALVRLLLSVNGGNDMEGNVLPAQSLEASFQLRMQNSGDF